MSSTACHYRQQMTLPTKFSGIRIRKARHEAGLTQAALAQAAGTRERNIIRWENDQHAPRFEHIAAIAKATGKDISFFAQTESAEDDAEAARSMPSRQMLEDLHWAIGVALGKDKERVA